MSALNASIRKITISLPGELVEYADYLAEQLHLSRSQVVSRALAQARAMEEERPAQHETRLPVTRPARTARRSAPSP